MANEEIILKLNSMQQEAARIEEQIHAINQQLKEFELLKISLEKSENAEEIMANLGNGVFMKAKPIEKKLYVNIGSNVIIKKTAKGTIETVQRQAVKLELLRRNFYSEIDKINNEMLAVIEKAQEKS